MNTPFVRAEIDLQTVRYNVDLLRKASETDLIAVVKGDAFGHGAVEISKYLRSIGIVHLGVATVEEALALRRAGDKGRILAWLYDLSHVHEAFSKNIDLAIFDHQTLPSILSMIPKNKEVNLTLYLDTGLHRSGVDFNRGLATALEMHRHPNVNFVGLMTHLVKSEDKNVSIVNAQLAMFRRFRQVLAQHGVDPPMVHAANTEACFNYDVSDFTHARVGCGLYGLRLKGNYPLKLTMRVLSHILQFKEIVKGEGVGYGWEFVASKKIRVALVPVGYSEVFQNRRCGICVEINGEKRKVLGRVSMDQVVVEAKVSDQIGDEVIVFGDGVATIYDWCKACALIPEEVVCKMGNRVHRRFLN